MAADVLRPDVLIIGAGPAGLTAAARLAQLAPNADVLVLDREPILGGIPRYSDHLGYGIRDLNRFLSGPAYARRLVERAREAGAQLRAGATVTEWVGEHSVAATTPGGRIRVDARAILLATGARERPRSARLIPGDRPAGVYTTGQLQNLVQVPTQFIGTKAVVVGAEAVSWSAVLTLREAGCRTALMTTEYRSPPAYLAFRLAGRLGLRVPVATRTRVTAIIGRHRVEAVEIEDVHRGERRRIECDAVVFTGDWIPDNELARAIGLEMDPATLGPLVDTALRTSRPGVFAAGNLLHPVDTADVAALDGHHVAAEVLAWLGGAVSLSPTVRIRAAAPLRWVAPGLIRAGDPAPARGHLLLWTSRLVRFPQILLTQDGRRLAAQRVAWPASPGRVFRVPASLLDQVDFAGGDVTIGLV